jgi:hypothetical protein
MDVLYLFRFLRSFIGRWAASFRVNDRSSEVYSVYGVSKEKLVRQIGKHAFLIFMRIDPTTKRQNLRVFIPPMFQSTCVHRKELFLQYHLHHFALPALKHFHLPTFPPLPDRYLHPARSPTHPSPPKCNHHPNYRRRRRRRRRSSALAHHCSSTCRDGSFLGR